MVERMSGIVARKVVDLGVSSASQMAPEYFCIAQLTIKFWSFLAYGINFHSTDSFGGIIDNLE